MWVRAWLVSVVWGCVMQQQTTALVSGVPVVVHQSHRWVRSGRGFETAAVVVSVPIMLSIEDVTAVLVGWVTECNWDAYEALAADAAVRELVADSVANGGCGHVEEARVDTAGCADVSVWAYCRERAAAVFGNESELDPVGYGEIASLEVV